jgi:glycerol uptake facilitator-like aquaporin
MQRRDASAYAAELVGTFLLVLFVALVLTVYSRSGIGSTDMVVVGLVQAFVLMAIGGTSGAHVNPAVTVALCAIRRITPVDAATYVLVQLTGAVLAVLVVKLLGVVVMVLGPITGAAVNPARAFGPALISGHFGAAGTFLPAYVPGPVAGALAAAAAYRAIVLRGRPALRPVDKLDRA